MKHHRYVQGFNLVEVMVVIAILAILLGLGVSGYGTYVANQKIRSAAEVFKTTLIMARAEAVKLNQRVEILRTNAVPVAANVESATSAADGVNLMVRAGAAGAFAFVEGRLGAEGTGAAAGVTPSVQATGPSTLTFDSFGMVVASTPAFVTTERFVDFDFSNPNAGACVADGGQVRCLRVRLSRGGQARLCDPSVPNTDTRFCGI